jgi:ring-1,2-phenylacetyl-CoA epoxidase subunit PaaA
LISNSAALIQFKSLSKVSFLPNARAIKRIMKEESFHYHHALNLATQLCNSGPEHLSKVQDGVDKWWFPVLAYFGPPDSHNFQMQQNARWRLKIDSNDDLRQQWLTKMVPVIQNIGLTIPDPKLRWDDDTQKWDFTEPDWDEVKRIIKGGGPASAYWHETLTRCYNNQAWVRNLTYNEGALVA